MRKSVEHARRGLLALLVRWAPTPCLARLVALGPAAPQGASLRQLSTHELGVLGEELAARYLRGQGFTLIGRNVDAPEAELDIVAIDGDSLVVVEVKAGWCPLAGSDFRWGVRRPGARMTRTGVARRLGAARRMAKGAGLRRGRVDGVEVIAGRAARATIVHHPGLTPGLLPPGVMPPGVRRGAEPKDKTAAP